MQKIVEHFASPISSSVGTRPPSSLMSSVGEASQKTLDDAESMPVSYQAEESLKIPTMIKEEPENELEKLRKELGEIGGAGHYFGDDRNYGLLNMKNKRDGMGERELRKVLRLLAAGETKINLKEREFRVFRTQKKNRENL